MGLFDGYNFNPPGYSGGGLLDMLGFGNVPGMGSLGPDQRPQFDAMGNFTGVAPDMRQSPFPVMPTQNAMPQMAAQPPMPWLPSGQSAMPQMSAPALPTPISVPQMTVAQPQDQQQPTMNSFAGLQVPTFGQPDQAAIPPKAQLVQQQPQQQEPQLPPALSPPSGLSGAARGFMANAQNGPLGMLLGGVGGAMGMQDDSKANLQVQYHATRQALIANGMEPRQASSTAMLSVFNPEAAKTILPEALSNKEKYQVISEDPLSGKKYGFVNDRAQTVNGQPLNSQGGNSGGSMDGLQRAKDAGVSGDALYAHLPNTMAPTVKAMIEGRQPLPSTTAMRSPATLAMIDAAHSIDPTFDATTWASRLAGRKDFEGGGKSAEMVRAANQTLAHVGSLLTSMDNLKNTNFPKANAVGNYVRENLGAGEQGAFRTNAHAVAEEMSKVFKGANMSDAEIRAWEQNLSENMSPAQQRAQVGKLSELLHGSLNALEEKRVSSIGQMAADKSGPLIKPEGQAVLKRIDQWLAGNNAPSGGAQPGVTRNGVKWSVQ